jgi:hypothetical protein
MSRVNTAADVGLLASAQSCAQRLQLSLEGLGGVSNILLLTGVGAGLVASFLEGAMMDRGFSTGVDA